MPHVIAHTIAKPACSYERRRLLSQLGAIYYSAGRQRPPGRWVPNTARDLFFDTAFAVLMF